jgi:hypothetical protein
VRQVHEDVRTIGLLAQQGLGRRQLSDEAVGFLDRGLLNGHVVEHDAVNQPLLRTVDVDWILLIDDVSEEVVDEVLVTFGVVRSKGVDCAIRFDDSFDLQLVLPGGHVLRSVLCFFLSYAES